MAECDERSWLAALSLMNSGMEADDGSNKTVVAVMCPINRLMSDFDLCVRFMRQTGLVLSGDSF